MNLNNNSKIKSGILKSSSSSHGILGHPYKSLSNAKKASSPESKQIGLVNLGNTCYVNSTIQALLGLPLLMDDSKSLMTKLNQNENKQYVRVVTPFLEVVRASEMCNVASATRNVYLIKRDLEITNHKFSGNKMEDASEFLIKMFESIEENLHRYNMSPNLIEENFLSERVQTFQCNQCKEIDTKVHSDEMFFCTLPVGRGAEMPVPLEKLVQTIFETDEVRERRCEKCGNQNASTTNRLVKLPRVLVITIKMYNFEQGTTKVIQNVSLPSTLDLSGYVADHAELPNSVVAERLSPQTVDEEEAQLQAALRLSLLPDSTSSSATYKLSSVVRHYGESTESGHYIAEVFKEDAWYRFDDARVSRVNNSEVQDGNNIYNPYIVMYVAEPGMDNCKLSLDSKQEGKEFLHGTKVRGPSELVNKHHLFKTEPADNPKEVLTPLTTIKSNREIKLFKKSEPGCSPEYPIILNLTTVADFKLEIGNYLLVDPLTIDIIGICLKTGKKYVVTDMSQVVITSALVYIKKRNDKKYLILIEQ